MSDDTERPGEEGQGSGSGAGGDGGGFRLTSEKKREIIWRIFRSTPDLSPSQVAWAIIDDDAVQGDVNRGMLHRAWTEEVRKQLRSKDAQGLPRAGPIAGRKRNSDTTPWRERRYWTSADYHVNMLEHARLVNQSRRVLERLDVEHQLTFGFAFGVERLLEEAEELARREEGDDDED
jgi:hypothetical protein